MIELKNLSKRFGDNVLFENVNMVFESGRIYGISGRNGCGKTVLLKLMLGLCKPDGGEILINGRKLHSRSGYADNTGFIIETPRFLPGFTGLENLMFLAKLRGKIGEKEVRQALINVGLDPDDKKKAGKYSLGMRQRLGIAQAIMENPDVLLLDEPTNALDRQGVSAMQELLRRYASEGKTILIATHIFADIDGFVDKLFAIENKNLTEKGGYGT